MLLNKLESKGEHKRKSPLTLASREVCHGARHIIMTEIIQRNKKVRMQFSLYKKTRQLLSLPSRRSDAEAL